MTTRPLVRLSSSYAAKIPDRGWLSRVNALWLLLALAIGFLVRVKDLSAQSLWNDEGTSVALAQTSLPTIINSAAHDIHPPLYYILLHFWILPAGITEFSLRFMSVFAGVLVIALTFRVAREFFDQEVAVIAAFLTALNPFQTYYAQETRMYIWVTLFALVSVWMMALMFNPPRSNAPPLPQRIRKRTLAVIIYTLATLAALYTNYYAFTLVLFENLAFLIWLILARRSQRPRLGHSIAFWIGAQVIIVLAYLPWIAFARASLTSWPGISEPMSLWQMTWQIASAFVTGADSLINWQSLLVGIYLLFFIGGLLPSRDLLPQSAWGIVTCALWALVPLAAMFVVSLSRPAYNPKFLLLATPGFLIVVARGISVLYPGLFLRERAPYGSVRDPALNRTGNQVLGMVRFAFIGLLAAGTVFALQSMYTDPRLQRDNYRAIVNYINALATSRDAVIVDAPGQIDVVRYYYHGAADLKTLPIGRPVIEAETRDAIADLATSHAKLYAIYWATDQSDPANVVGQALSQNAFQGSDEWHGDLRLAQYASGQFTAASPLGTTFGVEIDLRSTNIGSAPLRGGDILPIELDWSVLKPPRANYKVFVHLLDSQGKIIAQHDSEPQNGFSPTLRWQPGQTISDKVGLLIPVGTPPGAYSLEMGLYSGDTGKRLAMPDGKDALALGSVNVIAGTVPRAAVLMQAPLNADFDAIQALGYNLPNHALSDLTFAAGDAIPLELYWQARTQPPNDIQARLELLDATENAVATAPTFVTYPTSHWTPGEIVRDVVPLQIPADAPPGEYRIVLTGDSQTVDVVPIEVR